MPSTNTTVFVDGSKYWRPLQTVLLEYAYDANSLEKCSIVTVICTGTVGNFSFKFKKHLLLIQKETTTSNRVFKQIDQIT